MPAAQLERSATLFRRKYYENGSHAGFILYMTDAAQNESDIDDLRTALKNSKGPGNFRNLFMYAPNGKKDGIQLIPISEVAAKDDFGAIKNISRDDLLAALRIPPQLMGIVPQNAGGFGSISDAAKVWALNELEPLQARYRFEVVCVNDGSRDATLETLIRKSRELPVPYSLPATTTRGVPSALCRMAAS